MAIFLKNKTFIAIVCLLILLLPALKLMLMSPIYPSHDGLIHAERIRQFHLAIIDGQIPPRLAPTYAEGIGFPMFVVNYQLPYYLAEILMLVFGNPFVALKGVLSASYLASAVFAFLLFRNYGSHLASFVGALIFSYLPYRFANIYTRAALGESVALMFIPLVLFSLHQISKQSRSGVVLLAISTFGLITSHTVIFFLFLPFFVAYVLVFLNLDKKILIAILAGVSLGILLSSFQLIPAIFERQYTKLEETFLNLYGRHFLNIYQLLRIPKNGVTVGTPFQIGLVGTLIIILSSIRLFFKKNHQIIFLLITIVISAFFIEKLSLWFWNNWPFLKFIVLPWRFLSIIVVSSAILAVFLTDKMKLRGIFALFLVLLTLFTSRHYFLKPTQYESTSTNYILGTPSEFDTIWSDANTFKPRPLVETKPQIEISNLVQNDTSLSFDLKTDSPTKIIIRKIYFPGWKVKLNDKEYKTKQIDGLISFDVGQGIWQLKFFFEETPIRLLANLLTLGSFLLLLVFLFKSSFEKIRRLS